MNLNNSEFLKADPNELTTVNGNDIELESIFLANELRHEIILHINVEDAALNCRYFCNCLINDRLKLKMLRSAVLSTVLGAGRL